MQSGQQQHDFDWAATPGPNLQTPYSHTHTSAYNTDGPLDPALATDSTHFDSGPRVTARSHVPALVEYSTPGMATPSQPPESKRVRTSTSLAPPPQRLSTARSQPVLSARQPARVRDLADRFDQETADGTARTANEKYRRQRPGNTLQRQPQSPQRTGATKLQKRKPVSVARSPETSFEANTSFSSDTTVLSTQSQPLPYTSARLVQHKLKEPLFGEITPDGRWNGNFDFAGYGADYFSTSRRGSDGDVALGPRRHSQTELLHPGFPPALNSLAHKRSRSDMTAMRSTTAPAVPNVDLSAIPPFAPTATLPAVGTPHTTSTTSRIPVRGRRTTGSPSSPASRSSSAIPTPTSRAKTPSVDTTSNTHNSRYNAPNLAISPQLLSAKVVAPLPKVSPPLRSSRPRQPVSAATTAASRARAAGVHGSPISPSSKRPSEQWMGKPYDAQQERTRRRIPELGKVDFAERRARIQKALSQNLEESQSLESLKAKRNASRPSSRQTGPGADPESPSNIVDKHQAEIFNRETDSVVAALARQSLSLATANLPQKQADDAQPETTTTEYTEFEFDSPVSTRTIQQMPELPLLSATTYQPPKKVAHEMQQIRLVQDDTIASSASPSDIEDKWGLSRSMGDTGSIEIMLDHHPKLAHLHDVREAESRQVEAPVRQETPQPEPVLLQPTTFAPTSTHVEESFISRAISRYRDTGIIDPELLHEVDKHTVDLYRLSANEGTDAAIVQSLLESIAQQRSLDSATQPVPQTPQTPSTGILTGTALVFNDRTVEITPERRSHDAVLGSDDEDDFAAQIRRADEQWERQQRGEGPMFEDEPRKPSPLPKDEHFTPHSSVGPHSTLAANWRDSDHARRLSGRNTPSKNVDSVISEEAVIQASLVSPPAHASALPLPLGVSDEHVQQSPRVQALSGASVTPVRLSDDSQRQFPLHIPSQSISSFADSTKVGTSDGGDKSTQGTSPGPEQKRLQKRRNIMRELLDTENTYHQDLKIIEDIYKATVSDIVTVEDRKTLFGNCDEIERFSLAFYDQLRKAVSSMYTPSKYVRWNGRRGSMSTTQSDGTGQTSMMSNDFVDDEKDRSTTVGKVFLDNLGRMEQLYGAYLRNHDAANQRLSALQAFPTVKCWLDECHNNASDITSAWDLDSLLVKPTQRVSKYPLILQQLLEATPANHPDHENLKSAVKDTIGMLTRINDAKKRSDLVEQMISGKNKDTDVRSGLAKAFGRRTERLKERVGISEAFQDPEFDALAQAFGGHYIRLQVTMRDFQDYSNQVEKAIHNTNNIAGALEQFTEVHQSSLPEIESKWHRYGQVIRELTQVSLSSHKIAVQRRVISPLIALIKMHESPQKLIAKRKKHIVDYAKCRSIEKRGERPDRKTLEASEMYEALNDQLKIELPKLYDMTAQLVIACLRCFVDSQLEFQKTWERKLAPLLSSQGVPSIVDDIIPSFTADYEEMKSRLTALSLCNGSLLADSANFLSPDLDFDKGKRVASNDTPNSSKRHSRTYTPEVPIAELPAMPLDTRDRSNSTMSATGQTPVTPIANLTAANRPWSNSVTSAPSSTYNTRPSTATQVASVRNSMEQRSRHESSATFVTAQGHDDDRFSDIFSSVMPPEGDVQQPYASPQLPATITRASEDVKTLFVCASLFEFNIDKARKEAGYPYLTYEQGEVFDVVAKRGELWLAKNQDDSDKQLGWIWEQHFIVLEQD